MKSVTRAVSAVFLSCILSDVSYAQYTSGAYSSDVYNECVLSNMKGITSDVAAQAVKSTCISKAQIHLREKYEAKDKANIDKYGVDISAGLLGKAESFTIRSSSMSSMAVTNKTKDKTVTYVKFAVNTAPSGNCNSWEDKIYTYVLTLTSGSSVDLVFPNDSKSICTRVVSAKARPSKWNDFSISGSVEPVDKDPF